MWNQAQKEVFGDKWVLKDLSSSEINTFNVIEYETRHNKKNDRDPIVERYRMQLGMKCSRKTRRTFRGYRTHTTAKFQPIQERKRILQAARKAIAKQKVIDKKIDEIAMNVGERDRRRPDRNFFIISMIKESKCGRSTEALRNYIELQREQNPKSIYSILKPYEIGPFAERVVWIHKKLESCY